MFPQLTTQRKNQKTNNLNTYSTQDLKHFEFWHESNRKKFDTNYVYRFPSLHNNNGK